MRNVLILSGGGPKGIIHLGCISQLERLNLLSKYKTMVGTSVGSIICVLLACGFTSTEILTQLFKNKHIFSVKSQISATSFINSSVRGGISNISTLISPIEEMITDRLGGIPTLGQLYANGYEIYISAANLTTCELVYLSHKNHPKLRCTDALQLACTVPLIFEIKRFRGDKYCDAGLSKNFPILFPLENFSKEEIESILGIDISGRGVNNENKHDFMSIIQDIIFFNPNLHNKEDIDIAREQYGEKLTLITFPQLITSSILNLYLDERSISKLYEMGVKAVRRIYDTENVEKSTTDDIAELEEEPVVNFEKN